jgi:hypothetical protein
METPSATGGGAVFLPAGVRPLRADDPAELGGHTLIGRLGSGGMGIVYLGRSPEGGLVAVKSAHDEMTDAETVRRFEAEAACLWRVPPASSVRLIADGTAHRPPYIITEYVEGRSVEQVVETEGPLQPEQVRALAAGAGRALASIHQAGLIHRDLKPANILLTPTGPRVIDFGIAHEVGAAGGPTGPGLVVGSPGWISPERLNRHPATAASDIFGWGCLVAYAGTGRNPFGRGDAEELARRTLEEPPDLEGLEEPLRGLVGEALAKDPAERPSAADLLTRLGHAREGAAMRPVPPIAAFARAAAGAPPVPSGTMVIPMVAPRRQGWKAVTGAAVILAAVLAAVIVITVADHGTSRTPPSSLPSASPSGGTATHSVASPEAKPGGPSGERVDDVRGHRGKGRDGKDGGKGGHGHG